MSSEARVCLQCAVRISSLRRSGTKFCSKTCGALNKRNVRQSGKKLSLTRLSIKTKKNGSVLFHDCIFGGGGGVDPFVPERCKCKKTISEEKAQSLIARGEALDFESRMPVFTGGAIVQVGKLLRTPRSATVEKAHVERLTETASAIRAKSKYSEKQLREMHDAVELDKREKAYEQAYRLEHYNDLTMEARRAWIREVPADKYDAAKRRDWGRALFTNYKDERTPGGIGVDVDSPRLESLTVERWIEEDESVDAVAVETEEVLEDNSDDQSDEEIQTEQEKEDERTAEEVLAEYRER